ncbi:FGGY-family carbohydrate kinase [Pseudothermotoga sp. U03pept]|uniref:FGGY-family carbohydrate kinase n=1 Tax=Pseudothermotoga sp. U03pept TaxID=3447012 RepID=UPI003F0F049E
MSEVVLAIDCGTQSLRVLLFDSNGRLIEVHKEEYPQTYTSPRPGWAEQDVGVYKSALSRACSVVKERNNAVWKKIAAVVVTTQRDTCVFLDKDGKALKPAVLWLDQRMAEYDSRLPLHYRIGFKIVGMDKAAKISAKKCKANWVRQNEPEIWQKTHKFLLLSGWFHYLLTGNFVDSVANQIGHIPFNYKKLAWADPKHDYQPYLFQIERDKLPDLVQPATVIGTLTKEASQLTQIAEGTPLIAAGSDKGCETIALGCLTESTACASLGTTTTMQITSKRYLEPLKFMPSYPAVIPQHFNPEVEIFRGFWMVSWFKKEFGNHETQVAQAKGITAEDVFDELLKMTEPGSLGLMLQPYWGAGLKIPEARGAIIGFGDVHSRAYLYRAIIEGLSYALKDAAEKIQKVSGANIEKVMVTGGGSKSDFVCQTLADVLNKKTIRGEIYEGSGLGAAIVGFVGIKYYSSFEDAVRNMVRYSREFTPNQEYAKLYSQLYEHVYRKMYRRLCPLYKAMQEITGYPDY